MNDPTRPIRPDDQPTHLDDEVDPSLAATGEYPHTEVRKPAPHADRMDRPSPEGEHVPPPVKPATQVDPD